MPTPSNKPNNTEDIFAPVDPVRGRAAANPSRRPVVPYSARPAAPMRASGLPTRSIYLIIIIILVVLVIGGVAGLAWWRNRTPADNANVNQTVNQANGSVIVNPANSAAENQNAAPDVIPNVNGPADAPADTDRDGLSDAEEASLGTNPQTSDTDGDGLADFLEVRVYRADPLQTDTDHNGVSDGDEVKAGDNPAGSGQLFDITNQILNAN